MHTLIVLLWTILQVGGIHYTPYIPGQQQQQQQQQPKARVYSVQGYMVSTDGRIQKTRLRVSEETNPYALNTTGLLVVGYYDYSLGMWQNFAGGSRVDKCYTLGGGFESQFMYKALVSMQWVYFDL